MRPQHEYTRTIEDPDTVMRLEPDAIYIDCGGLFVRFLCPCGCGDEYRLLNRDHESAKSGFGRTPRWSVKIVNDRMTLHPSVNRTAFCKSHFWIKGGVVEWA